MNENWIKGIIYSKKTGTLIEYHIPLRSSTGIRASFFMNYLNLKCPDSIDIDMALNGL